MLEMLNTTPKKLGWKNTNPYVDRSTSYVWLTQDVSEGIKSDISTDLYAKT